MRACSCATSNNLLAAARGHWVLCGSVSQVVDTLQEWFEAGAADGFNVMPASLPSGLDDFVDLVVPELQRRGLLRTTCEGKTLRDLLGLARPGRLEIIGSLARADAVGHGAV